MQSSCAQAVPGTIDRCAEYPLVSQDGLCDGTHTRPISDAHGAADKVTGAADEAICRAKPAIRRVMLVVMQHHGLRVDVRLERRIVIRQRRQQVLHLSRMSFLTDTTPLTPRATSTALLLSAWELTKPLN